MKTSELIELQRSIATGNWDVDTNDEIDPVYQMTLGQEWKAVGIRDPDGIESVIALCHPNNARAIALVPELIDSVLKLEKALTGLLERSSSLDQSATHEGLLNCDAVAAARTVLSTIN